MPLSEMNDDEDIIDYFYNNPNKFITCKYYLEGTCRYGDSCKHLHPVNKPGKTNNKKKKGVKVEEEEDDGDEECVICL